MTEKWRGQLSRLEEVEPSDDLWTRAMRRAGDPHVTLQPPGRRMRWTGLEAAAVALAAVVIAIVLIPRGNPPQTPVEAGSERLATDAWEIRYPERFYRGSIPPSAGPRRVTVEGTWIGNVDRKDLATKLVSSTLEEADLPERAVIVVIYQSFGGPGRIPSGPDSSFPLSFSGLQTVEGNYSGVWKRSFIQANGEPYTIQVRIGSQASGKDRRSVEEMVSSFRILPLKTGSITGRHVSFFVLERAASYAVGSVTRFDQSTLPTSDRTRSIVLYLVRVPAGFYALTGAGNLAGGYSNCDVRYEPRSQEFACDNGARWKLDGSVITKPGPTYKEDWLSVLLVRISLDGHVLVSPDVHSSSTEMDLRVT